MAVVPLAAHFHGDFVLKLLPVETTNTMDEVAAAAAANSVGIHVPGQPGRTLRVRKQGVDAPYARESTVAESGLEPTECIEIYYE
ncbi:toluene-4-monooxygenase system B family protein [Amycolatopsis australiensis]|uniref:Toluene 4-monooxygenase protein B n=1 Tax=Amycolatopsis australiensis TaxID=546364 RepID=A0A1K1RLK1_9PSEU|nr:toluene-4-monooxygenase system B family protein [Amycolatopsis australiensis]SFW73147.1 toluene 4-monooxygenase protein B [Amycolatopsis australiensis]